MLLRELSRWYLTQAAVWSHFVVVPAPFSNARRYRGSGLERRPCVPRLNQVLLWAHHGPAFGSPLAHAAIDVADIGVALLL